MRRALLSAVCLGALLAPAAADAQYAPVDAPGPALSVPQPTLDAALECTADVSGASRAPVLFVAGTTVNPDANFSWNYQPALTALGIPWCAVTVPGNSMADIQVAGEYIVNAIRAMHARAGRSISIIGHSQGGMSPRWALRFWPDTRAMVDDVIGFAPSNHGTISAEPICLPGCSPAFHQQRASSEFTKALNSGQETFPGISYTNVYSHLDLVVVPNLDESGSSSLHGGGGSISNVASQDICPLNLADHLGLGTFDPVAYELAVDALAHPGPADPSRIPAAACTQALMPGVNPLTFATDIAAALAVLATTIATYPHVAEEPPLACYVTASCGSMGAAAAVPAPAAGVPSKAKKAKKCKRAKKGKKRKKKRCKRKHRRGRR